MDSWNRDSKMGTSETSPSDISSVLQFLQQHGFKEAEAALLKESKTTTVKQLNNAAKAMPDVTVAVSAYEKSLSGQDPENFIHQYSNLCEFADNALDITTAELHTIVYPVLVHTYLSLVCSEKLEQAADLLQRFSPLQESYWQEDLKSLARIKNGDQLEKNEWFCNMRKNSFAVRLSNVTFLQLQSFLLANHLIENIIKSHMHIEVYEGNPRSKTMIDAMAGGSMGESLFTVNNSKIFYGLLKDVSSGAWADDQSEQAVTSKDGGDKDKKRKKSSRKDPQAKKNRPDPNAPPLNRIPLPDFNDLVKASRAAGVKELARRARIARDKLPSICLYTAFNTSKGMCCADVPEDSSMVGIGYGNSNVQVWTLTPDKLKPIKKAVDLENIDKDSDDIYEQIIDDTTAVENITFTGHSGPVYGTSFSPDKNIILSCSEDETVRLWSLQTWTNLVVYRSDAYPVWDVSFSPYGYYFATGHADSNALLWTVDRHQPIRIFPDHFSDVTAVEFHPNSNYIATGSADRTVRLMDVLNGQSVRYFTGNKVRFHVVF